MPTSRPRANAKPRSPHLPRQMREGFEPLQLTTTAEPGPVEREPLFFIDGVEYTIPVEFPTSVGLQFIDISARQSTDAAIAWLLEEALGTAGYRALLGFKELNADHLAVIVGVLEERVLGSMEPGKGESRNA